MATFKFKTPSGGNPVLSGSFTTMGFFGSAGLGDAIQSGVFQDYTNVTNIGASIESGRLQNVKLTNGLNHTATPGSGSVNASGAVAITGIATGDLTLQVQFFHSPAVQIQNAKFFAWDGGGTLTNAPSGLDIYAFENGDTNWVNIGSTGQSTALTFGDHGSATEHNYFAGVSARPTSIGSKTFSMRFSLEYF